VLAAVKATNTRLQDHTYLFQGAGEASIGIATLLAMAMEKREGVPLEKALARIWLKDSKGLIVAGRSSGGISEHKAPFAHEHAEMKELGDIVKEIKPTVLIGAAGVARVFTTEIIKDMASFNEAPIIFALSNPTSLAECTAEEAYTHSDGRAVFASGSPFPTFVGFGKTYEPGQGNNAYIFPGAALAIIAAGIHHISDGVFLSAAEGLADMVTKEDIAVGRLYPPLSNIREISVAIAAKVATEAYASGTASTYPEPEDKEAFIRTHLYDYNYDKVLFSYSCADLTALQVSYLPSLYSWPEAVQEPKNKGPMDSWGPRT
jgi:malate dehydrogenase (oxaloacetate-decarboxylating)(NADP+)